MTLTDICMTIVVACFVPACAFFAINDALDEKPCIFINRLIHKNNTNLRIYKLLTNYDVDYAFPRFGEEFAGNYYLYPELLTNPLREKEKKALLNAYRFVLGLINTNTFNKDKETEIIFYIFHDIIIPKDKIADEKIYEKENFIIGNYKLLSAVLDKSNEKSCYDYWFINIKTNEKISVTIDFDRNYHQDYKNEVMREKLSFLFE